MADGTGTDSTATSRSRQDAREDAELRRRIGSAGTVDVRLDTDTDTAGTQADSAGEPATPRQWDGLASALVSGDERLDTRLPYSVLGGPGTGKTSLLVDTVVDFLDSGGTADEVMVVAPSKEAAGALRDQIADAVRSRDDYATTGTMVRSVHSWAFAFLRAVAQEDQAARAAQPRLMTGAEHDLQIRTLLRGHAEDGTGQWPEDIRPALPLVGFARQLRDLLLRAAERGVDATALAELGARYDEPMWSAAGDFLREYGQIQALSATNNLNASELLHTTLAVLDEHPEVLERHRGTIRLVLVDDAHNLDPASGQFISRFMVPGVRSLVAGDPDQCVFHFRGADETFLTGIAADEDRRVVLSRSHRLPGGLVAAVNLLETRLPAQPTRVTVREGKTAGGPAGLAVRRSPSRTADTLVVTDEIRRAHVIEGVPWDDIAVVVRSTADIPVLRRALLSHGVPVKVDPTSVVLADQPLVRVILLALDALVRPLSGVEMQQLIESPIGGADPVMLRRVERAVAPLLTGTGMRAMDAVTAIVTGQADAEERELWTSRFGPREQQVIERVTQVIEAGRAALDQKTATSPVEAVLWAVWQAADLSSSLQVQALRGGTLGSQADRDLDAVMSLFDLAGDVVERTPTVTLETFLEDVRSQELPTGGRDRRGVRPDAVEILPAHAAAGRQWGVVVVAGVQEDSWPAGPTVGGLFGQQELVDLIDRGISPHIPVSRAAAALSEERRLFLLAVSRARIRTLVTAVDSAGDDTSVPSRFLEEIEDAATAGAEPEGRPEDTTATAEPSPAAGPVVSSMASSLASALAPALPRVLALEPLIAELRDVVCDGNRAGHERDAAAHNLARLAEAGVYGANPDQWWGIAPPSTTGPAVAPPRGDAAPTVRISPTTLESLDDGCDTVAFLRGLTGGASTEQMKVGVLIHAVAEGFANGLGYDDARDIVADAVPYLVDGPSWTAAPLTDSCLTAVDRLYTWILEREGLGRTVEVERTLERRIGTTDGGLPIVLAGRADRVETDAAGRSTVVDFKTGRSAKTKKEAAESRQLSAYQLLIDGEPGMTADGAMLVYPRRDTTTVTVLQQAAMSTEELEEFRALAVDAATRVTGPVFRATAENCESSDYACLCPACRAGEQVI
ncbi:DNA/RNA helicase, superfamily I [Corynebacterium glyciniphilum AJ 3170]|uniref:DNA 3'-5' helicase n=1 Tax=Corynebacterium glyciniphilum AJ 3170 TaxID=1404245 RepID=X5DQ31_9CORY|nr:ATP-dependent DNA helicase [Corynebacterium glyciniphilum]AHW63389.1 DNA/RNA helicase, superfamily I [Corynebacterium glyciniphilum AJ 3170]